MKRAGARLRELGSWCGLVGNCAIGRRLRPEMARAVSEELLLSAG